MTLKIFLLTGLLYSLTVDASCQHDRDCLAGCAASQGSAQETRWDCLEASLVKARAGEGQCQENILGMSCTCMAENCTWMLPEGPQTQDK